jgi:uncharacterized metal-binding protein YceD (DUF177 family)
MDNTMIVDVSAVPADGRYALDIKGYTDVPEALCPGASRRPVELSFCGFMERKGGSHVRFSVAGMMRAQIYAQCAVCLKDIDLRVSAEIDETFAREPDDIDQWPITGNKADLAPMCRSVLLTSLPARAVCGEDCIGFTDDYKPPGVNLALQFENNLETQLNEETRKEQ